MAYRYSLTTVIPASARDIYDAWLDSVAHSRMTGGQATASADLGAAFVAWDGYITGRNLELTPGERIVQAWRTTKFPEDHEDSIITLTFEERDGGTLVTLSHSNVPEGHLGYEQGGWQKSYFEPMIAYFSNASPASAEAEEESASRAEAEERSPRRAARPARRARAKRPAAKKTTTAPKASSKNASGRNKKKTVAPKARPKPRSARKTSGARKKAVAQKAQRKRTATKARPKAKPDRTRARKKPKVRARTRARAARRPAGGRRR